MTETGIVTGIVTGTERGTGNVTETEEIVTEVTEETGTGIVKGIVTETERGSGPNAAPVTAEVREAGASDDERDHGASPDLIDLGVGVGVDIPIPPDAALEKRIVIDIDPLLEVTSTRGTVLRRERISEMKIGPSPYLKRQHASPLKNLKTLQMAR